MYLDSAQLEAHNLHLQAKYSQISEKEALSEGYLLEDAQVVIVAFGICARIAQTAVDNLREQGLRAGLFRPVTLWPFPEQFLKEAVEKADHVLTVEMNAGQMLQDVRLSLPSKDITFYGRMGGVLVSALEIEAEVKRIIKGTGK